MPYKAQSGWGDRQRTAVLPVNEDEVREAAWSKQRPLKTSLAERFRPHDAAARYPPFLRAMIGEGYR